MSPLFFHDDFGITDEGMKSLKHFFVVLSDNIMFEEVDMNEQNEDKTSVNEERVDCSDVFNTSQVIM